MRGNYFLYFIMAFYWFLLVYYSYLTILGVYIRNKVKRSIKLESYPSVAVLIPCHNEEVVIGSTLSAMVKLSYPGKLDIYALNDNSSDNTAKVIKSYSEIFTHIHYIEVPPGYPKGKSRVLNYGLSITSSDYICVYDADNQPEPFALTELVHSAETVEKACGAVGIVRTINAGKNMLTKMIAIEFKVFQLIMQLGRWQAFKAGSFGGTNMLISRQVLTENGGYDLFALAEDAELTIRLTAARYTIPVNYKSITWEQEPESLKTYIRQRTRWLIGNLYLLEKSIVNFKYWKSKALVHTLHYLMTYFLFVIMLITNIVFTVMVLLRIVSIESWVPLVMLWYMAYVVYTVQIIVSLQSNKTLNLSNLALGFIMYFTYAQFFLLLLARSTFLYVFSRLRKTVIPWDKTERVDVSPKEDLDEHFDDHLDEHLDDHLKEHLEGAS